MTKGTRVSFEGSTLVDWDMFGAARSELGSSFVRVLGYFHEDGTASLNAIEAAGRALNATAMVLPAHKLKGEAYQFGATPLADQAERIEVAARACVESRDAPMHLIDDIVKLRPLFEETMRLLEREANPLAQRRPAGTGFGRRG